MQKFLTSANLMHGFFEHLFFESCLEATIQNSFCPPTDGQIPKQHPNLLVSCFELEAWRATRRSKARAPPRPHSELDFRDSETSGVNPLESLKPPQV